ncbi:hypothetical protein [Mediterranea massiliensis]|nr:hypothetical protein [Mediterranea massiliensis]
MGALVMFAMVIVIANVGGFYFLLKYLQPIITQYFVSYKSEIWA